MRTTYGCASQAWSTLGRGCGVSIELMRRNRITQARRAIDKAVDALISRMGTYGVDFEAIRDGAEINVELIIDDDLYRRVEVADLYLYSDKERQFSNIEKMVRKRLEEAVEAYNRETESAYMEGLNRGERQRYYAWLA